MGYGCAGVAIARPPGGLELRSPRPGHRRQLPGIKVWADRGWLAVAGHVLDNGPSAAAAGPVTAWRALPKARRVKFHHLVAKALQDVHRMMQADGSILAIPSQPRVYRRPVSGTTRRQDVVVWRLLATGPSAATSSRQKRDP
jgi:hypothetical protein